MPGLNLHLSAARGFESPTLGELAYSAAIAPLQAAEQDSDPEVRKANLVQATLTCLKRDGFQGASIRKISAEAGVSVGLISHHYSGKDELVAEAVDGRGDQLFRWLCHALVPRQLWPGRTDSSL